MKCTMLCFILIGLWSAIPLCLGETSDKEKTQLTFSQEPNVKTPDEVIAALESKINEQAELLVRLTNKVAELEDNSKPSGNPVQAVGFTVKDPIASPTRNQITFRAATSNFGGGFNLATGKFTCTIPGTYYFSASLLKTYDHYAQTRCAIYLNDLESVFAVTGPTASSLQGSYAAVNGVYVHLVAGDNVTLARCTVIASFNPTSSFLGFLVTPDVQAVGFTVKDPIDSPTRNQITFRSVISNVGGGFNLDTGKFTCTIPGTYYFSAALTKAFDYEGGETRCLIRKNNEFSVGAITMPSRFPSLLGWYAAVNGVYIRLAAGDTVALAQCTVVASFFSDSSFSGFLVTPYVI